MKDVIHHFNLAAFALLLTSLPACAAKPSDIPQRFNAQIGGFLGATYRIELRGNKLAYTKLDAGNHNPESIVIIPTATQWRDFRQTLDKLSI